MISHCGFDWHFPDSWYWATFHVADDISISFCSFFNQFFLLLSYNISLYILGINLFSDIWFGIVLSHSAGWLPFHFADVFLCCADFWFDIVPLIYFCLCCHIQNPSWRPLWGVYLPCFPLGVLQFQIWHLSFNAFEFILWRM